MANPLVRHSEILKADEQQVHDGLDATFDTILKQTAQDYGYAVRAARALYVR